MNVQQIMQAHPNLREIVSGWRVAVVEDEPDNVEVVIRLLNYFGAVTATAENGKVGLEIISSFRPSFVITDLSMPVMDGWELKRRLSDSEALRDLPVVALTAHAMVGHRERVLEAGFFAYFSKPLDAPSFIVDLVQLFDPTRKYPSEAAATEITPVVEGAPLVKPVSASISVPGERPAVKVVEPDVTAPRDIQSIEIMSGRRQSSDS